VIALLPAELLARLADQAIDFTGLTLLALIQGLTEFLPISSSGHLVLAQSAMGLEEPALALDVALHVGTLLAVFVVYRRDLAALGRDALAGDLGEALRLGLATLPAGLVGVLLKDRIQAAFHSPTLAAYGLLGTALVLLAGEWARRRQAPSVPAEESAASLPTYTQAFLIGCAQALAILPGVSRSGSTIAAGVLSGLAPERAARFSFLLSIPAILGAAVLNLPDALDEGLGGGVGPILWAALFAGFVGWGALRVLLAFLGRGAFAWFAAYCVVLASGALLFA